MAPGALEEALLAASTVVRAGADAGEDGVARSRAAAAAAAVRGAAASGGWHEAARGSSSAHAALVDALRASLVRASATSETHVRDSHLASACAVAAAPLRLALLRVARNALSVAAEAAASAHCGLARAVAELAAEECVRVRRLDAPVPCAPAPEDGAKSAADETRQCARAAAQALANAFTAAAASAAASDMSALWEVAFKPVGDGRGVCLDSCAVAPAVALLECDDAGAREAAALAAHAAVGASTAHAEALCDDARALRGASGRAHLTVLRRVSSSVCFSGATRCQQG